MAFRIPEGGPVRLRTSIVSGEVPVASEIEDGELALNVADGKVFWQDEAGAVQSYELGGKVASTTVTAIVALTLSAYEAISPKSASTLYLITDASDDTDSIYLGETALAVAPSLLPNP